MNSTLSLLGLIDDRIMKFGWVGCFRISNQGPLLLNSKGFKRIILRSSDSLRWGKTITKWSPSQRSISILRAWRREIEEREVTLSPFLSSFKISWFWLRTVRKQDRIIYKKETQTEIDHLNREEKESSSLIWICLSVSSFTLLWRATHHFLILFLEPSSDSLWMFQELHRAVLYALFLFRFQVKVGRMKGRRKLAFIKWETRKRHSKVNFLVCSLEDTVMRVFGFLALSLFNSKDI